MANFGVFSFHFFGQGTDILAYSPTIFHRTLAADFIKDSHMLFVSLRVAYTLTAGAAMSYILMVASA